MRLLLVVNDPSSFFSHRKSWAERAASAGYEVHLAGPFGDQQAAVEALGFTVHSFPFVRGFGGLRQQIAGLRQGRRVLKQASPDLIHLVGTQLVATLGPLCPSSTPVVASITGLGHAFLTPGAKGMLMRGITAAGYAATLRRGGRFVFQNPDDLKTVRKIPGMADFPADLIRGSGVDTTRFPFAELPEVQTPRVVFPARLIREKGVYDFLDAVRLLKARKIQAVFELVGDIDTKNPSSLTREELENAVAGGLVEWHGRSNDMVATFSQADVVALPSFREGLPKALLEAASMGRPLVATDVPGCREIVQHEVTGLLVPLGDTRALADALARLIDSLSLRRTLGAGARRLVDEALSLDQVSGAYHRLYQEVVRTNRGS